MKLPQWRERSFAIITRDGLMVVDGLVRGAFGIRCQGRHRSIWTVTHLPSGCKVTPGTSGFCNLELAKAFADRLAGFADWSRIDSDTPCPNLGQQVAAIWNELIARDMAVTVLESNSNMPRQSLGASK